MFGSRLMNIPIPKVLRSRSHSQGRLPRSRIWFVYVRVMSLLEQ